MEAEERKKEKIKSWMELNAWGVGRNEGIKIQPEKATGVFNQRAILN